MIPDAFNKIKNPSFENGTTDWGFTSFGGGNGEGTNGTECAWPSEGSCDDKIDMTVACQYWHVSLYQPTDLDSSKTYDLTFYARSDYQRTAHVVLAQNHSPWYDLTSLVDFNTDYSWQKYEVELTPSSTDSNGRLLFYVGDNVNDIYFDNVKLREKQATKLTDTTPEFSAIYDDPDSGDYATDYQLQIIKYDGDWDSPLWDSGKTEFDTSVLEGDRTEDIVYDGPELRLDGMKYYWKIKLWDDEDNEGPWTNGKDYFTMAGKRIQDLSYTYDNVGNITQIIDESETYTKKMAEYAYDDLYRLTSATITDSATENDYTQTYTYDSLGNFLTKSDLGTYTYTGNQGTSFANPDAVTGIGAVSVDYDNNGNLTNLHWGAYSLIGASFDYNNRIAASSRPNGQTQSYAYDHTGQRIIQDLNSGSKTTVYANQYYETTTEGEDVTETLNIYALGQLIGTATNDGESFNLYLVHPDHLSSSSVMTNFDETGSIDQVIDYFPFGSIRFNQQNSSANQTRKFTGKIGDDATTLQYFGARYYQGDVGRFWSQDPVSINIGDQNSLKIWRGNLVNPQKLNSYSYAINNPLIFIDPLGLWNEKTGTVEKGDTLGKITNQVNSIYNTNYSVKDVASLNSIKNPDKINVGQIIKPNETTPDVSQKLNSLMGEHADFAKEHNYGDIRFGLKERPHGDWDLKSQPGIFCQERSCGGQQFESYIYKAQETQGDTPGNIHYGYVGRSIGKSIDELLNRASQAQGLSDIFSLKWPSGDRPNDTPNIIWGFNLFK